MHGGIYLQLSQTSMVTALKAMLYSHHHSVRRFDPVVFSTGQWLQSEARNMFPIFIAAYCTHVLVRTSRSKVCSFFVFLFFSTRPE